MLQEDNKFLEDFFIHLCNEECSLERRGQLVQFLKELCSLAQPMQHVNREEFFKVILGADYMDRASLVNRAEKCRENLPWAAKWGLG